MWKALGLGMGTENFGLNCLQVDLSLFLGRVRRVDYGIIADMCDYKFQPSKPILTWS